MSKKKVVLSKLRDSIDKMSFERLSSEYEKIFKKSNYPTSRDLFKIFMNADTKYYYTEGARIIRNDNSVTPEVNKLRSKSELLKKYHAGIFDIYSIINASDDEIIEYSHYLAAMFVIEMNELELINPNCLVKKFNNNGKYIDMLNKLGNIGVEEMGVDIAGLIRINRKLNMLILNSVKIWGFSFERVKTEVKYNFNHIYNLTYDEKNDEANLAMFRANFILLFKYIKKMHADKNNIVPDWLFKNSNPKLKHEYYYNKTLHAAMMSVWYWKEYVEMFILQQGYKNRGFLVQEFIHDGLPQIFQNDITSEFLHNLYVKPLNIFKSDLNINQFEHYAKVLTGTKNLMEVVVKLEEMLRIYKEKYHPDDIKYVINKHLYILPSLKMNITTDDFLESIEKKLEDLKEKRVSIDFPEHMIKKLFGRKIIFQMYEGINIREHMSFANIKFIRDILNKPHLKTSQETLSYFRNKASFISKHIPTVIKNNRTISVYRDNKLKCFKDMIKFKKITCDIPKTLREALTTSYASYLEGDARIVANNDVFRVLIFLGMLFEKPSQIMTFLKKYTDKSTINELFDMIDTQNHKAVAEIQDKKLLRRFVLDYPNVIEWDLEVVNELLYKFSYDYETIKAKYHQELSKKYKTNNEIILKYGIKYKISKDTIEEYDELLRESIRKKHYDVIKSRPFIMESKDLVIKQLHHNDPLKMFVGLITNCCQHLDSVGGSCVVDCMLNENSTIVVWEKSGDVIAQSWVWTNGESIVFDSIETVRKVNVNDIAESLLNFANILLEENPEIKDIRLGSTMHGVTNLVRNKLLSTRITDKPKPAKYKGYDGYLDGKEQDIIVSR